MNFKTQWLKGWLLLAVLALAACAPMSSITAQIPGRMVDHAFEFDAFRDSRDIEILQYRYGDDGGFNTRSTPAEIASGTSRLAANTTGEMLLGKDLYVKWRIKSTGQVYEDTVDLTSRLPFSMKRKRLRFIVEGEKLYVYVIEREDVRDVMSVDQVEKIRRSHTTPREKAFDYVLRNRVTLIYPEKQIDPTFPLTCANK
jgi:hypothetical protein